MNIISLKNFDMLVSNKFFFGQFQIFRKKSLILLSEILCNFFRKWERKFKDLAGDGGNLGSFFKLIQAQFFLL